MSKKELIRKTAIDLFATKGFNHVSTPMIAEAAQISVGTIYNYFENKDDILNYIFYVEYSKRETLLLTFKKSNISIVEKIQDFIEFHITTMINNPNTAKVVIQNGMLPSNQKLEYVNKCLNNLPVIFTDMLRDAQNKEKMLSFNPELVGPAIFFAARGVAYSLLMQKHLIDYSKAMGEFKRFLTMALLVSPSLDDDDSQ